MHSAVIPLPGVPNRVYTGSSLCNNPTPTPRHTRLTLRLQRQRHIFISEFCKPSPRAFRVDQPHPEQVRRQQGLDLTHFQVAQVAGALFSCRDPMLVETGGTVYGEAVKAPGCGRIRYICRTSPEAACQLAPAQPFLVIPLTVSHLRPGQTVTTAGISAAAPTCLAWPGQGAQAQLSGKPTAATAGPSGSQVQPWGSQRVPATA